MMITSYWLGQKHYPIPYAKKKLIAYLVIVTTLYLVHRGLVLLYPQLWFSVTTGTLLLLIFGWFISTVEHKEFQKMPLIGKFFVPKTA